MKSTGIILGAALMALPGLAQNTFENQFRRPLGEVLTEIGERFQVRLKYDIDTTGLVLPYADSRIRPYSVEESLTNVLMPFDFKFVKQNENTYKLKRYEYPRRTEADGRKMVAWLNSLYSDKDSWEQRRDSVKRQVRELLTIDDYLAKRVDAKPVFSKVRKFDGYTVQNFYLETLTALYGC
ncbi:MAG: hypothetical protein K2K65_07965, partial [Duncaniella sp.]|nr:hypothetical protein [Duncaniella sp.]